MVPYNHSNLDSDEVLYYVEGNYKARKGIEPGSLSLHPQGIPHGPHPGTVESTIGATHTNELAVMCDTFAPLNATKAALGYDDLTYPQSWESGWEPTTNTPAASNGAAHAGSNGKSNGSSNGKSKSAKTTEKNGGKKPSRLIEAKSKGASKVTNTSKNASKKATSAARGSSAARAADTWQ